jgi:exosortase C (VPDSG-CTERM-specific)
VFGVPSNKLIQVQTVSPQPALPSLAKTRPKPWTSFALGVSALVLGFAVPLWELARFAVGSNLYSYILLIPLISLFLVWRKRGCLALAAPIRRGAGALFFMAGGALLAVYWLGLRPRARLLEDDYLPLMITGFLLLFLGLCAWFWGGAVLRSLTFPLAFLFFMVPMPAAALLQVDAFLQQGSAAAAEMFFRLSGMPFLREGLIFQLPGIALQIAPECSGIHSTLVLLITSFLAGYLQLSTGWKRAVLVLAVIPLALLRNGFRVYVLGELCVHVSPRMIDSPIHHQGGPIFFVLSLIPLFVLLMVLQRSETREARLNHAKQSENDPA